MVTKKKVWRMANRNKSVWCQRSLLSLMTIILLPHPPTQRSSLIWATLGTPARSHQLFWLWHVYNNDIG